MTTDHRTPDGVPALELLKSADSVSVRELPGGGVAVVVDAAKHRNVWALPLACFAIGVASFVGGYALHVYGGPPGGYVRKTPVMLMVLGALNVVLGPMILAILAMQGPPRNILLEAAAGRLKADRSIAGDHVVSNYGAEEVQCLFVDGGALYATTRKGEQPLVAFGRQDLNEAIATVLAAELWKPSEPVAAFVQDIERWVIMPSSRVDAGVTAKH